MSEQTLRERLKAAIDAEHQTRLGEGFTAKGVGIVGNVPVVDLQQMLDETAQGAAQTSGPAPATIFAIQHYERHAYREWSSQYWDDEMYATRESAQAFVAAEAQRVRDRTADERVRRSTERHDEWRRKTALKAAGFNETPGEEPEVLTHETALPEAEQLTDEQIGCRVVEIALAR